MAFPLFAPTVLLGEPCPPEARVPVVGVSHARFDALLGRYVDDGGRVAYAAWKGSAADLGELHAYLAEVGRADVTLAGATRAADPAELAYWINVYNALTLAGVLRVYPTTSVRNHTGRVFGFNMWKNLRLHVGGGTLSLSEIEHNILRGLNEPRVHFALVCGSNGCPALPRHAFTPDAVSEQLDASARAFVARPDAVRVDPVNQVVSLSKLFRWYGDDFGPTPTDWLTLLRRFLPPGAATDQLDADATRVQFLPYDWALNDRPE